VRDAVDAYTLALNLAPSDARLFANRAAAFMRLKRWPDMLADADGALALEPANVKALLRRAEALRNMGLRHQALEVRCMPPLLTDVISYEDGCACLLRP
jgi:tetratricopeptide (TPR) repeat protein